MTTTNSTKHTRGEWSVDWAGKAERCTVRAYSVAVALVYTGKADAALIAAAPDMLAALRGIVDEATRPVENAGQLAALLLLIEDAARAAIAKATA